MTCSIEGCEREFYAKSWCQLHYGRWHRTGEVGQAGLYTYKDIIDLFWDKVKKQAEGCWLWTGSNNGVGYGQMKVRGTKKNIYAHRFAYELLKEKIPEGYVIDHLCRNPPCVNPDHLEVVTFKENLMRGQSTSAKNARKTHCIYGHAYTEENTYRRPKKVGRECKVCIRARSLSHAPQTS